MFKKIAIIGSNIFAPGGTTRSNINLIKEFSPSYQVIYFNEAEFSKRDVVKLKQSEGLTESVQFYPLKEIQNDSTIDVYIITRETFFKLAKLIKNFNSNSKVIGEIHGPLPLIKVNLSDYLPYFDSIRVATPSIKEQFIKKYNYDRVFVQTVSLYHLKSLSKSKDDQSNNLLIYSRFDEEAKDIAYAIKLVAYVVHEIGYKPIRLYINGYGNDEILYEKLIESYDVSKNVIINGEIPKHYIYVCTSKYETFGYSIVEAISEGHRAALYCGDDNVIKENFKDFKSVCWLTKNIVEDGEKLVHFIKKEPNQDYLEHDLKLIHQISEDYVSKFIENISKYSAPNNTIKLTENEAQAILGKVTVVSKLKKVYQILKAVPVIRSIVKSKKFKRLVLKIIDSLKKIVKKDKKVLLKENAFFVESFNGRNFSGDAKYLSLAIKKVNPEAEIYVSSVNELVDMEIRQYNLTPIRYRSSEYVNKFKECKYVIMNDNAPNLIEKQEGQIFIQTWYGNRDLKNNHIKLQADYLLTSSAYNTQLLSSLISLENVIVVEDGLPGNEFLIVNKDNLTFQESLHIKYFNKKFPANKKYILLCLGENIKIKIEELILSLPAEYELIVYSGDVLRKQYSHERIHTFNSEIVDIQELYLLSEVLITDFSLPTLGFAHLNRKIIVLQNETEYGGVYKDVLKKCGLQASDYSTEELVKIILEDDDCQYNKMIKENLLSNDAIGSSDKIIQKILKY